MTRAALTQRLARLEETVADDVPLIIQRWLGEALTPEQIVAAAAEWETVRTLPIADLAAFPPDARAWLAKRGEE